ncbi:hypothetical protein F5X68DRAFT_272602 [Plectosphaerella plurivora]|uniref:F-box domain-containing protein n=1 Tax=Plectosphaerella plurivora TaxID=936078 RepID=A0A9P8VM04_9PEZI|nr:hypothetical protein F5X68DRAFT_272602 [Plectosphaerella plurivora]
MSQPDSRTAPFCAVRGIPFSGFHFAGHLQGNSDDETNGGLSDTAPDGYDASVLSQDDIEWVRELEMLVTDPGPYRGSGKTCWSKTGTMSKGTPKSPPTLHINRLGRQRRTYRHPNPEKIFGQCYHNTTRHEPVYPVHTTCQAILETFLTASYLESGNEDSDDVDSGDEDSEDVGYDVDSDVDEPDLDVLHTVFRALDSNSPINQSTLLGIQYHEPLMPYLGPRESGASILTPLWNSVPRWEFLLANPFLEDRDGPRTDEVRADLKRSFRLPSTTADLSARAGNDILTSIPRELLDQISSSVDNGTLLRLTQASWHIHQALHDNHGFWQARLRTHMGWFPELQAYLEDPWPGLTQHPKALFLWAMRATESKPGLRGPYLRIANRRRIWYICDQITDQYIRILSRRPTFEDPVATEIIDEAWSPHLPLVAHPVATFVTAPSDAFWLCDWNETWTEMILETFWDGEGSLVGMSVAPKGKMRLLGMDDSDQGVHKETTVISENDWIREIVLHIPRWKYLEEEPSIDDMAYISPKGMTVYFLHSPPLEIGDCGPELCQRLFRPQEDATIVGVQGQIGVVNGHRRIIRFGIIQAPSPDRDSSKWFSKYAVPEAQQHLWAAHPQYLDGCFIWDLPDLDLRAFTKSRRSDRLSNICHDDLVPLEALSWAMTPEEHQTLAGLSAIHVGVHDGTMPPHMRNVLACIGSLRVEYTAESGIEPRQIGGVDLKGRPLPTDDIRKFVINGPRDERVWSARASRSGYGLELETSYGRTTSWFYDEDECDRGIRTAMDGHVGVGLAVAFGIDQLSGQTISKVASLLTLPSDTVGEAVEWDSEEDEVHEETDWDAADDWANNLPPSDL